MTLSHSLQNWFTRLRPFFGKNRRRIQGAFGLLFIGGVVLYALFLQAPSSFPRNSIIAVPQGATLSEIAEKLEKQHVIRSAFWFRNSIILFRGERAAMAGEYYFSDRENVFSVAKRIAYGDHRLTSIKVTLPEGTTNAEMAVILALKLPGFDVARFLSLVKGKEGRLFPDTYFFLPTESEEKLVETMERNFDNHVASILVDLYAFGKPLEDVVTMASILEEEARTEETRRTIAGILWKRLAIGMPLQVDAAFAYIMDKNTYELTEEDLKVDSPYNTYKYAGLPKGAITNPGLASIRAAVTPIKTPYLYYLSDREGNMYYAKTHEEHVKNKAAYLNK